MRCSLGIACPRVVTTRADWSRPAIAATNDEIAANGARARLRRRLRARLRVRVHRREGELHGLGHRESHDELARLHRPARAGDDAVRPSVRRDGAYDVAAIGVAYELEHRRHT